MLCFKKGSKEKETPGIGGAALDTIIRSDDYGNDDKSLLTSLMSHTAEQPRVGL